MRTAIARMSETQWPKPVVELARGRTTPFLDAYALEELSIRKLLEEAYLQGFQDAFAAMSRPTGDRK